MSSLLYILLAIIIGLGLIIAFIYNSFVVLKTPKGGEKREVVVGLSGKDGSVEILSGLVEGEVILGPTK